MPVAGVLCIVDQDYDGLFEDGPAIPNMISVENDVETVLIRSPAFDRLLVELGSKPKLTAIREAGQDTRVLVRDAAKDIGLLRIYSRRIGNKLRFDGMKYQFVGKNLLCDRAEMIRSIMNLSKIGRYNNTEIENEIEKIEAEGFDVWRIVNGHDMTAIIGKALQFKFGNLLSGSAKPDEVEKHLRMAYAKNNFDDSNLGKNLKDWQEANLDYPVYDAA
ncbi:hypothetical protein CK226_20260 [Mesorhizobium sp. WSM4311]|nr:hypothetical protein CK226_20260 [Mesorhizobium sp. WSM4311]